MRAGSAILVARMTGPVPECHVFRVEKIDSPLDPDDYDTGLFTLRAGERMRYDIIGLVAKLGDGFRCRNYLQMAVSSLLYTLHAYHSRREVIRFFASVLSPDMQFSEFVRLNWEHYQNIDEMARALGMRRSQFSARFRSVFGTTPREWMQRQKAQAIYRDICSSGKPLKEIAINFGFTDRSNFHRYCVANYGTGPGEIRRNLMAEPHSQHLTPKLAAVQT
jgi:AraC-like DNA-binding protein